MTQNMNSIDMDKLRSGSQLGRHNSADEPLAADEDSPDISPQTTASAEGELWDTFMKQRPSHSIPSAFKKHERRTYDLLQLLSLSELQRLEKAF